MRIEKLLRETLLSPLQKVIGIVGKKQISPILANVLFYIKNNTLCAVGTDQEVELSAQVTLESAYSGESAITVPGRKLLDIVRSLPEESVVDWSYQNHQLHLKAQNAHFILSTLTAEAFPRIKAEEAILTGYIPENKLKQLLQRTAFCIAKQDVRDYLTGLFCEVTAAEKTLRVVGTDGHRMGLGTIALEAIETTHLDKHSFLVPRKGIAELLRILEDSEACIEFTVYTNHILIKKENCTLLSLLLNSRFPDYKNLIPSARSDIIEVDCSLLQNVLSRIAVLCNPTFRGVRFIVEPGRLQVFTSNTEQEIAQETILVNYSGPKIETAFNVDYLLEVFSILKQGTLQLRFSEKADALLLQVATSESKKTPILDELFIIMSLSL